VGSKADLLNPVFTGTPTAATAAVGTSTTQLATTAFAVLAGTPTASLLMWPTATPPAGYLLCNGQTANRAAYAALFAIVGTLFGAGDGSTTFTLPDYRDRMPMGAGTTYSANSLGGSKDATLPSHNHSATVSDPSHSHSPAAGSTFVTTSFSGDGSFDSSRVTGNDEKNPFSGNTAAAVTGISVSIASAGSSATNANLPPYLGIFFIIKT
jgi:microcystin-dependent protein